MKGVFLIIIILTLLVMYNYAIDFFQVTNKNPKILNLILYSETSDEYLEMYKILSDYLKKTGIIYYFYAYRDDIQADYIIIDDIIYLKGVESFIPGCLEKTLKVFDICKNIDFDYIVRSNISQLINFKLLKNALSEKHIEYGGETLCINLLLGAKDAINVNYKYFGTKFIQGNAIIFDRKIFDLIVLNTEEILSYGIIDDISFGIFLKDKVKDITYFGTTFDIYNEHVKINAEKYDPDVIFYRNKNIWNRKQDVINMKKILDELPF